MAKLDMMGRDGGQSSEQSRAEQSRAEQSRIEWIDTSKGIGLLFVMLGHCYLDRKYTFWFTSFHMALFFFLSGYTFRLKKENYLSFMRRKVKTLVVPYCFLALITMICEALMAITHGHEYETGKIALLYLIQKRYTLLWYLSSLFVAEMLLYPLLLLHKGSKNNNSNLIISIICGSTFFLYKAFLKSDLPWNADLAILAMAFMLMGIYCRKSKKLNFFLDKNWVGLIAFGICIIVSTVQFYRFGAVDWYSNSFGNPLAFSVAAICGTLTVVSFARRVKMTALSKLGENSILFFGLHRIIIDLSFVLYGKIGITIINDSPIAIIWAMISVAIAILTLIPLNWIIIKYFPWALGRTQKKVNA